MKKYIKLFGLIVILILGVLAINLTKESIPEYKKVEKSNEITHYGWIGDKSLVVSNGEDVFKYNLDEGENEKLFETNHYIYDLLPLSENQIYYISISEDHMDIGIFDSKNELVFNISKDDEFTLINISPDSKNIMIDFENKGSFIYNVLTQKETEISFERYDNSWEKEFYPIYFTGNNESVVTLIGITLTEHNLDTGEVSNLRVEDELTQRFFSKRFVQNFGISPSNNYFAISTTNFQLPSEREVIIVDLTNNQVVKQFKFSQYANVVEVSDEIVVFESDNKIYSYIIESDKLSETNIDMLEDFKVNLTQGLIAIRNREELKIYGVDNLDKFFTLTQDIFEGI